MGNLLILFFVVKRKNGIIRDNYGTGIISMTKRVCSICYHDVNADLSLRGKELPGNIQSTILANLPRWNTHNFVCRECIERFISGQTALAVHLPKGANDGLKILPTPVRLGASPRYTGRGVTIAFLDSGFYSHPDLNQPEPRIICYKNLLAKRSSVKDLEKTDVSSWHGMMTSVVASGNGYLSGGI